MFTIDATEGKEMDKVPMNGIEKQPPGMRASSIFAVTKAADSHVQQIPCTGYIDDLVAVPRGN